jgi:hypothetical protein
MPLRVEVPSLRRRCVHRSYLALLAVAAIAAGATLAARTTRKGAEPPSATGYEGRPGPVARDGVGPGDEPVSQAGDASTPGPERSVPGAALAATATARAEPATLVSQYHGLVRDRSAAAVRRDMIRRIASSGGAEAVDQTLEAVAAEGDSNEGLTLCHEAGTQIARKIKGSTVEIAALQRRFISEQNPRTQQAELIALLQLRPAGLVDDLFTAFDRSSDGRVRANILSNLGSFGWMERAGEIVQHAVETPATDTRLLNAGIAYLDAVLKKEPSRASDVGRLTTMLATRPDLDLATFSRAIDLLARTTPERLSEIATVVTEPTARKVVDQAMARVRTR